VDGFHSFGEGHKIGTCYGDCKRLFCDILQIQPAGLQHVVDEFCSLSEGSAEKASGRCCRSALSTERFLRQWFTATHFVSQNRLKAARSFPVVQSGESPEAEPDVVLRSLDDGNWYISDSTILESAFRRKIDLLLLEVKQVRPLRCVFEHLGCQSMLLSNAVTERTTPHGMCVRDKEKEQELQCRLKHIEW